MKLPQRTEEMSPLFRGVRERRGHDVKKNFDGWPPPTYAGHKNVPSRSFGHIFFSGLDGGYVLKSRGG